LLSARGVTSIIALFALGAVLKRIGQRRGYVVGFAVVDLPPRRNLGELRRQVLALDLRAIATMRAPR
jgi:hypothetical protein